MTANTQIYHTGDTICAISTAPGTGGIAVVRISGPDAISLAAKIWKGTDLTTVESHTAHLGTVRDTNGSDLDQAVATVFRAPASFTGENVVEISIHGSRWIQRQLITALIDSGCRHAINGEFTRRAFLSGKLDLAQAEAVADMIASSSRAAHALAMSQMRGSYSHKIEQIRSRLLQLASLLELELDFAEEDVEFVSRSELLALADTLSGQLRQSARTFAAGSAIKDGIPVAIVGATNAGKSSLLNAILADNRAIVSDIPGTTRDIIEDTIEIGDYLFRLKDTAGIRQTDDTIEQMGIQRSIQATNSARIIILAVDTTSGTIEREFTAILQNLADDTQLIIAQNKIDLPHSVTDTGILQQHFTHAHIIQCSAISGQGVENLKNALVSAADRLNGSSDITVANARHYQAFVNAADSLDTFAAALRNNIPTDLAATDLRHAIGHLAQITGQISTPEILNNIFQNFCIGK